MKFFRLFSIFVTAGILLSGCSFWWSEHTNTVSSEVSAEVTYTPTYTYVEPLSAQKKMAERKNRLNFHALIKKGDYYALKNERDLALKYYINVHTKLKNDRILEKKIANLSFDAKKFDQAYDYFIMVPVVDLTEEEKFRMLDALVFQNGALNANQELNQMPIREETKQYFRVVASCTRSIDICFRDVRSSSGASLQLAELRTALENAAEMSQEATYPQALLATTFYDQGRYLSSYFLGKDIVDRRPDYRPVIKLVGMSALRLGNFEDASKWLMQYRTFEPHDPEASAALGDIYLESDDHVSSNLYFNAAISDGFENRAELERKLAYNYYLLDDKKGMFKVFRYLLGESTAVESDFVVAVATALESGEISKAGLWVGKGLWKYDQSSQLFALSAWVFRLRKEISRANEDLTKAIELDPKNTIALLNIGIIAYDKGDYGMARDSFEKVIAFDRVGSFVETASGYLSLIPSPQAILTGSALPK